MEKPASRKTGRLGINSHRLANYTAQAPANLSDGLGTQLAGWAVRVQAGLIEHLICNPVTDTREDRLVQQHGFYGRSTTAQYSPDFLHIKLIEQSVKTQLIYRRAVLRVLKQPDSPQPPNVAHGKSSSASQAQLELAKLRPLRLPAVKAESSGHSEMKGRPRSFI
jgi:hypothetical protein